MGLGESLNLGYELHDGRKVLARVLRCETSKVVFIEVIERLDLPGEQAAADWRVSHNGDAKFTAGVYNIVLRRLDIEAEETVFDLNSGDRVDSVGSPDSGG